MYKCCGVGLITFLLGASMADSASLLPTIILSLIGFTLMFMGVWNENH